MSENVMLWFVSVDGAEASRVDLKRGDELIASRPLCPADEDWKRAEAALVPLIYSPQVPQREFLDHSYADLRAMVEILFPEHLELVPFR